MLKVISVSVRIAAGARPAHVAGMVLAAAFLVAPTLLLAQQATIREYERAALFQDARSLVSRMQVRPNWVSGKGGFWYLDEHAGAKSFVYVESKRGIQEPAFDHARLAKGLAEASGQPYTAMALPFSRFEYRKGGAAVSFGIEGAGWECDLAHYRCQPGSGLDGAQAGEVLSPDGRWAVSLHEHNLWLRDTVTNERRALTQDGQPDYAYSDNLGGGISPVTDRLLKNPQRPAVSFSPNSRYLLGYRADLREVRTLAVVQTVPGGRPVSHAYRYPMPGDEQVARVEILMFDLAERTVRAVDVPAFGRAAYFETFFCWSDDSRQACFTEETRGYKTLKLHVMDVLSGQVRTPVIEHSDTQVPYIWRPSKSYIVGNDLFWISERDGWGHLYRIDVRDGTVRQQLTHGDWVVRRVVHVDVENGYLYFVAAGREPGQDPYYDHLYRIKYDGTGLRRLTPEHGHHSIDFSPEGGYFVDTYSRLDAPPVSVLRRSDGALVRELRTADITALRAAGWKAPRLFQVKAADGKTDIYGAMFLPSNFDPGRRYPVLDSIYPGPQAAKTPKSFDVIAYEDELALAELGFIVVTIDGMGTPGRSKAFRDVSYGNLGAAGGLEDHIAGLRQLAERHPQMDLDRVGIYGISGGGYASTRALLKYPQFYKVAVSAAGNHDQRSYMASWGERFQHWPVTEKTYSEQANPPLAANLQGKLLLVHGDMDDNVHHTHTLQMADALIAANKDFDLLILPNRNHALVDLGKGPAALRRDDPYFLRKRWDYFVEHLQGVAPPKEFRLEFGKGRPGS